MGFNLERIIRHKYKEYMNSTGENASGTPNGNNGTTTTTTTTSDTNHDENGNTVAPRPKSKYNIERIIRHKYKEMMEANEKKKQEEIDAKRYKPTRVEEYPEETDANGGAVGVPLFSVPHPQADNMFYSDKPPSLSRGDPNHNNYHFGNRANYLDEDGEAPPVQLIFTQDYTPAPAPAPLRNNTVNRVNIINNFNVPIENVPEAYYFYHFCTRESESNRILRYNSVERKTESVIQPGIVSSTNSGTASRERSGSGSKSKSNSSSYYDTNETRQHKFICKCLPVLGIVGTCSLFGNVFVETGGTFDPKQKQLYGRNPNAIGLFQMGPAMKKYFDLYCAEFYAKHYHRAVMVTTPSTAEYCRHTVLDPDTMDAQITFVISEIADGCFIGAGNASKIRKAMHLVMRDADTQYMKTTLDERFSIAPETIENATEVFCTIFERPAFPHMDRRKEQSLNCYNYIIEQKLHLRI